MLHLAVIGSGAIGTGFMELLKNDAELSFDTVIVPERSVGAARALVHAIVPNAGIVSRLALESRPDLLVEFAGHQAIEEHVLPALARGIACMVVSTGALSTPGLPERLEQAARNGGTQVHLLSGAIGGIDALAAARVGGLDSVIYTGRKPPRAWKDTPADGPFDLDRLASEVVIFEGSAREAAALYPKNANVAATVSLAGLGLDRTQVRLLADPAITENVHHLEARGAFGSFELTMRGKPLAANPKTSALTVYSIVRALRNQAHALSI
jgi:aspartate dehydrogenase